MSHVKLPVLYIPHGGGPWPFVDLPMFNREEVASLKNYLETLLEDLKVQPSAILIVSAHWEEPVPTLMSAPHPPMLYDYYGFPPESYKIQWPAPGSPGLAQEVRQLLQKAGFQTGADSQRGFDHGAFVPLKLMVPRADIPSLQLSLIHGLDPGHHIRLGEALRPMREKGVLIVGSGMSYHNLRKFGDPSATRESEDFDTWLQTAVTGSPGERNRALIQWESAPSAKEAHPRSEHLLPLMVVAGAAGSDAGSVGFSGYFGKTRISAFHFG